MQSEQTTGADQTGDNRAFFSLVGQWMLAGALGAVVLPRTLGESTDGGASLLGEQIWLLAAGLLAVWIVFLAPRLIALIRAALTTVPWDTPSSHPYFERFRPGVCAVAIVAIIDVALGDAILRAPLRAIVGGDSSISVDEILASAFLVAAILLFLRLQFASSALLEAGTWCTLDAVVPTVRSGAAAFTATGEHRTLAAMTNRRSTLAPTESQNSTNRADLDPTILASTRTASDVTATSPPMDNRTLVDPRTIPVSDATLPESPEPPRSSDR